MARVNPFMPGAIVSPYMFAGRGDEILKLETAVFQAKHDNAQHFLVQGERGIGKSSLFLLMDKMARGKLSSLRHGKFHFLVVSTALDASDDYSSLLKKLAAGLSRELEEYEPYRTLASSFAELLVRIEAYGVKVRDRADTGPADLVDDFAHRVHGAAQRLEDNLNGILVLIDEVDSAPVSANVGAFIKHLSEALTRRDCRNIIIGVAGVTGVIDKLAASHASAPRILEIVTLKPLERREVDEVLNRGLERANTLAVGTAPLTMTDAAKETIASLSEGYPHFIQQFAFCAFEVNTNDEIGDEDVWKGALQEHGALEQLGEKYFKEMYQFRVSAVEVRKIFDALAEESDTDGWRTYDQIASMTGLGRAEVISTVVGLENKGVVAIKAGEDGVVRLTSRSFGAWIRSVAKGDKVRGK